VKNLAIESSRKQNLWPLSAGQEHLRVLKGIKEEVLKGIELFPADSKRQLSSAIV
jgi:hypothetical protein